jgi:hypothetical protein
MRTLTLGAIAPLTLSLAAFACSPDSEPAAGDPAGSQEEEDTGGPIDLTVEIPSVGEHQLQFASPEMVIPPYTETVLCFYGTYEGADIGVTGMTTRSHEEVTHHSGIMGVYDEQFADGELVDCSGQGLEGMGIYPPLFFPVGIDWEGGDPIPADVNFLNLPAGAGFRINTGQRWALDLHYINYNDRPVVTNTVFTADVLPADQIDKWIGAVMFDSGPFDLQPGDTEAIFDCTWEAEYDVVTLMAHMHTYGSSFKAELVRPGEEPFTIFDIPEWSPNLKDYPPVESLEEGDLHVNPGDIFRTTCTWSNQTGEVQPYPAEMCSLEMAVMPLEQPLMCVDGTYIEEGEAPN